MIIQILDISEKLEDLTLHSHPFLSLFCRSLEFIFIPLSTSTRLPT